MNRSGFVGSVLCFCAPNWACGGNPVAVTGVGGNALELGGSGGFVAIAPGAGGSMSAGGSWAGFSPICGATLAGDGTAKGIACTLADVQVCYKTCGPQSIGFKSETCAGGIYMESTSCYYPAGDYSCYKIPSVANAECPGTPQHGTQCTVPACIVCASVTSGNGYTDPGGSPKLGYCVCATDSATGVHKWSCAPATAWPCPGGSGC